MDYSNFHKNNKIYSGAERKIGITVEGEDYIIKFRKKERFGTRNNHLSEYIGCRVIASMGYNVQKAYLGTFNGEDIVAIKDFVGKNQQFVAFNDLGESSIEEDRDKFTYSYDDITRILRANNKLKDFRKTISQFWELYIIDALLGNFDRHGGNWGFLKEDNVYSLAPVFDNGSCLFPKTTDENEMIKIIQSKEETERRIFEFPKSQILLNGKKSSYYDVISSLAYKNCNAALENVHDRFDNEKISSIVNKISVISDTHKEFYKHMILNRYEYILNDSYERMRK